jgi:DNA-directed RNA polymerase specialized sigma24 family protein
MNTKMYTKALRYAFMLMPYHQNYYDLVHDAWIAWHKSRGTDLFEEEERTVIVTVKNVWRNYVSKNRYMHNGEHLNRVFEQIDEENHGITPQFAAKDSVDKLYIEAKRYYGTLAAKVPAHKATYERMFDDTENIVNLRYQGYSNKEIQEKLNISSTTIKKYMTNLQEIVKESGEFETKQYIETYNPFAANKVVVTKTISSKTYDAHKERYDEYEYDTDNGADHNEYYKLLVHKEKGTGLLIRNK